MVIVPKVFLLNLVVTPILVTCCCSSCFPVILVQSKGILLIWLNMYIALCVCKANVQKKEKMNLFMITQFYTSGGEV